MVVTLPVFWKTHCPRGTLRRQAGYAHLNQRVRPPRQVSIWNFLIIL